MDFLRAHHFKRKPLKDERSNAREERGKTNSEEPPRGKGGDGGLPTRRVLTENNQIEDG